MTRQVSRIMIADDHHAVIAGMTSFLSKQQDLKVIEEVVENGEELIPRIKQEKPHVLCLDMEMPNFKIHEKLPEILELEHVPKVIIVSAFEDHRLLTDGIKLGISGYLMKDDFGPMSFVKYIRRVLNEEIVFSPKAEEYLKKSQQKKNEYKLSTDQNDVLGLMLLRFTPAEIGLKLGKSTRAVYNIQSRLRIKLGVNTNREAEDKAVRLGIAPLGIDAFKFMDERRK